MAAYQSSRSMVGRPEMIWWSRRSTAAESQRRAQRAASSSENVRRKNEYGQRPGMRVLSACKRCQLVV